jgi:hypothetical protein
MQRFNPSNQIFNWVEWRCQPERPMEETKRAGCEAHFKWKRTAYTHQKKRHTLTSIKASAANTIIPIAEGNRK